MAVAYEQCAHDPNREHSTVIQAAKNAIAAAVDAQATWSYQYLNVGDAVQHLLDMANPRYSEPMRLLSLIWAGHSTPETFEESVWALLEELPSYAIVTITVVDHWLHTANRTWIGRLVREHPKAGQIQQIHFNHATATIPGSDVLKLREGLAAVLPPPVPAVCPYPAR